MSDQSSDSASALRADVIAHLRSLGLSAEPNEANSHGGKSYIRLAHGFKRAEKYARDWSAYGRRWPDLIKHFAHGCEVNPQSIDPELVIVEAEKETGYLFRFASLLWSVPVSTGYGRRMRFLVRDRANGKLIGIFALGDPVFNLRARDTWVDWDANARRQRLVHVMDAFVLGSVPPYSQLLGGKLVASLIGSREVSTLFRKKYSDSEGIISGIRKNPCLVLVTVTSALGRSSLYNRLKLSVSSDGSKEQTVVQLERIGTTEGYGHFQLSDDLFERLRNLLEQEGHPYANGHQFGQGPNWRMRVMRVGLDLLGLDPELSRHGISREVYVMALASNAREFLRGEECIPKLYLPSVTDIANAAKARWIIPRATRRPSYVNFRREQILEFIRPHAHPSETLGRAQPADSQDATIRPPAHTSGEADGTRP